MGTMSFGESDSGREGWPIPYEDAVPFFRQALDLGITFWDTANGYNAGTSEEAVVVATKVFFPVHDGPGGSGLSRNAIMEQVDDSLTRLGSRNCLPDALELGRGTGAGLVRLYRTSATKGEAET
jgi:aryl-alcohol dehydrogenase-like predicted oxidoreductase